MKLLSKRLLALTLCCCMALLAVPAVTYADTDGTELQITDQPEQLILQLGQEWAGVEFELKTDAGLYPQPIVVNEAGVLKMDLGGSQTYTLSALRSSVPIPSASATQEEQNTDDKNESTVLEETSAPSAQASPEETGLIKGIPNTHLFLFGGGLIICIGGLIAMRIAKRRQTDQEDAEEYDDDDYEE